MSLENSMEETASLGAHIRSQREQKGLSLEEIAELTKISPRVLAAIENDDYDKMPADAFCRGFYSMYANTLKLDPEAILARYQEARGVPVKKKHPTRPPVRKSATTPNYAEPAAFSPAFVISMILGVIAFLLICAGLYLGWNPGTYLGETIQTLKTPQSTEQFQATSEEETEGVAAEPAIVETPLPGPIAETLSEQDAEINAIPESDSSSYTLQITFDTSGTLQITLDDGFTENRHFMAGETMEWLANEAITLSLPEETTGTILLNGVAVPLPEAEEGKRSLHLPEDLLDQ